MNGSFNGVQNRITINESGQSHLPDSPMARDITPDSIYPQGTASCSNCPPPTPNDPDGQTVILSYQWTLNGTQIQSGPSTMLDCQHTAGCGIGTLAMRVAACDPDGCSYSPYSNPTQVIPNPPSMEMSQNAIFVMLAIAIPLAVVAIIYMGTYLLSMPHLRPILNDELFQILATAVVLLSIVALNVTIDEYVVSAVGSAGGLPSAPSNITGAMDLAMQNLRGLEQNATQLLSGLGKTNSLLGAEASRSIFCNMKGVGFTLTNCSPLNAFRGSLVPPSIATAAALADIYAQMALLSLARQASFSMIIPLGLLLRCFKLSRNAGNTLIAIGFGFYTAYPIAIVATNSMFHGNPPPAVPVINMMDGKECDPQETSIPKAQRFITDRAWDFTDFAMVWQTAYFILVRVLLCSILSLIITLGFIRVFAKLIGSELDVSSLARIS